MIFFFNFYAHCPLARQSKLLGIEIPVAPFFVKLTENLVPRGFFEYFLANVLRDLMLLLRFFDVIISDRISLNQVQMGGDAQAGRREQRSGGGRGTVYIYYWDSKLLVSII